MNLGVFGGKPDPNPAHQIQLDQHDEGDNDMEVDNVNWPAWSLAIFVNDNVAQPPEQGLTDASP